MESDITTRLRALDVGAVSDSLDAHGLPSGISTIKPMWPCPLIAGRVVTVKLRRSAEPSSRHLCTAAIDQAESGDIVFVDGLGLSDTGAWGGLLSRGGAKRGLAGAIIFGASRDIDEARVMGFPVYAISTTPRTARGRLVEEATGVPIDVDGVVVHSGDYVIADGSGIAIVPQATADSVVSRAERIAARERLMASLLDEGRPAAEVMAGDYESMLNKVSEGSS